MFFELSRRLVGLPPFLRWCAVILAGGAGGAAAGLLMVLAALGFDRLETLREHPGWLSAAFALAGLPVAWALHRRCGAYRAWETERLPSVTAFFEPHELAGLSGWALGLTLRGVAEQWPDEADAGMLRGLARRAEEHWPALAGGPGTQAWLRTIPDRQWLEFAQGQRSIALTDEQIDGLLKVLGAEGNGEQPRLADPAREPRLRRELGRRFSVALRRVFKRDFERYRRMPWPPARVTETGEPLGEGAWGHPPFGPLFDTLGLALDLAAELIKTAAPALKTPENRQAGLDILQVLRYDRTVLETCENTLPLYFETLVQQLAAAFQPGADTPIDWPHPTGPSRFGPVLAAGLVAAAGLALWSLQPQTRSGGVAVQQESAKQRLLIEARLRELLVPRQIGEDPTQRPLPSELLEQVQLLLEHGSDEQKALAQIAIKNDAKAASIIDEIKREPVAEAFRLLTLEGHNGYNAGEFDRAAKSYEQALALQPEDAEAHRNAAAAHGQARQGDIAAHRQRAIELLQRGAGLVPPRSPEWCEFQNNLGLAWAALPTGDRGQNLRQAIDAFYLAQDGYTRDLAHWAKVQNNLGMAWLKMPDGDRESHLQNALDAFRAALGVYTPKTHPLEWATTQNHLGLAWAGLTAGDPGENLARAAAAFRAALEVLVPEEHPLEWADTQNQLGRVLDRLATGDPGENRRQAIAAFQAAGKIYSRAVHPLEWASTRFNQAVALHHLAENTAQGCNHLWQSVAYLKAAAGVWTPEAFPAVHQDQVAPLAAALRETWRTQGCGGDAAFEGIPAAE
jgi:tetratricopeptide (TPR) repeat protein